MNAELEDVSMGTDPERPSMEPTMHALHVKNVPYDVWCRARHNANLSGLAYRDYVIRLLAQCEPFLPDAQATTTE